MRNAVNPCYCYKPSVLISQSYGTSLSHGKQTRKEMGGGVYSLFEFISSVQTYSYYSFIQFIFSLKPFHMVHEVHSKNDTKVVH
jgi:hypothetical protein